MDRGNTKQEILEASLELFSVQGFEATSISQIAEAVGIRKASLYSHFESKQAILDALVKNVLAQYEEHSIFALPHAAIDNTRPAHNNVLNNFFFISVSSLDCSLLYYYI